MTSRGGDSYDRKFLEAFVRPGPDDGNWGARSNMPALGVVQTGATQMSFYITAAKPPPPTVWSVLRFVWMASHHCTPVIMRVMR